MDLIKPGRVIDFMGMRRFWIILSASLVLISTILVSIAPPGLSSRLSAANRLRAPVL